MNKLNDTTCYLGGPIEHAGDDGIGFRKQIKEVLKQLGINFLDPTDKPEGFLGEIQEEKIYNQQLRSEGRITELRKRMKKIRRLDLRCVDKSDFRIFYVPDIKKVPICGTVDEIITAERQKKPIFGIFPDGRNSIPMWLFAVFNEEEIFYNIEDLKDYLIKVDNGVVFNDKWVFLEN